MIMNGLSFFDFVSFWIFIIVYFNFEVIIIYGFGEMLMKLDVFVCVIYLVYGMVIFLVIGLG